MPDAPQYEYVTLLNILFQPLDLIDEKSLSDACPHRWYNQTLCSVNDSVVRLGVVEGEYHWHQHEDDDEFFYVIEGKLSIQLRDRTIELGPRQGVVIPKGTVHRPSSRQRTVMLMMETASIVPTGSHNGVVTQKIR